MQTVNVKMSREIFGERVEFSADALVTEGEDYHSAVLSLASQLRSAMNEYVEGIGTTTIPAGTNGYATGENESIQVLDMTHIQADVQNGKRRVRVFTPRFQKYGIPVYPEVLAKLDISKDDIPTEGFKTDGWKAQVLFVDNKPKKAVSLVRPNDE